MSLLSGKAGKMIAKRFFPMIEDSIDQFIDYLLVEYEKQETEGNETQIGLFCDKNDAGEFIISLVGMEGAIVVRVVKRWNRAQLMLLLKEGIANM
jgi:hypothetical protein